MGEPKNLAEDLVQEPHRVSALLREEGPARKVRMPRGLDVWIVTGYAEARAVLSDSRVGKDPAAIRRLFERDGFESAADSAVRALGGHMLNSDPPDHTRLRKLVNQAFTSRTVSRLRPRIEQITAELLDGIGDAERVDLLPAFAVPLPIRVICELLGVHAGDQPAFATWSNTMVAWSTPEELQAAAAKMHAYLVDLIEEKRAEPAEDLLSGLIHASDEGDSLSADELLAMAFLLLVAGFETTVNLIANSVFALLREPDQLAALRADPALLPGAIEEFLRYDGAIHLATIRFTREPSRSVTSRSRRVNSCSSPCSARTATPGGSRTRTGWTSRGRRRGISRSGTASTTASAHRWPGWRPRSRCAGCWSGSRRSAWTPSRKPCGGGKAPSSTAWKPSLCACAEESVS